MIQKEDWPGYVSIRHDDGRYIGRVWWKETHVECYCHCEFWNVDEPVTRQKNEAQRQNRLMAEAIRQVIAKEKA